MHNVDLHACTVHSACGEHTLTLHCMHPLLERGGEGIYWLKLKTSREVFQLKDPL